MNVKKLHGLQKNMLRFKKILPSILIICLSACITCDGMNLTNESNLFVQANWTSDTLQQLEMFLIANSIKDEVVLNKLLFSLVRNTPEKCSVQTMRLVKKLQTLGANPTARVGFAYVLENGKSANYATSVIESYSTSLNEAKGDLKIYLQGLSAKY